MATSYPMDRGHGRGKLRIYLGAAPGVGKTYAMLAESQRRRARGTDVVGALAESEEGRTVLAPQERVQLLGAAARAVDHVSRLVDDLRDLSRLHAGAVETYLRPVDLDEVVTASLDDLGPGREKVTLSLAEDLPDVIADATLLTRILTSLLADAVHRSLAGPPPVLTAACSNGWVEVRINDQGPDERGGPASLALRLATDLAEAMGMTLRCERTPSGGRTVIIVLPAAASPPSGAQTPAKYTDDEMQLT